MKQKNYKKKFFWWFILVICICYGYSFFVSMSIFKQDADVKIYFDYATKILGGEIPYKDFFVVYPPFSLLVFVLPAFFTKNLSFYNFLFELEMVMVFAILIYVIYLLSQKLKIDYKLSILYILFSAIFLNYYIIKRYDIFVALLTILSIYLLFERKYWLSSFVFVCGILAKLYPIILSPLYFIYILKKDGLKKSINFSVSSFLFLLIMLLPFFIIAPPTKAQFYSFQYHFTRPLHCESLYGSILLFLEKTNIQIFKTNLKNDIYGWTIYTPLSPVLLLLSALLILTILGFLTLNFWKKKNISEKVFLNFTFVFLLVFIVFNRVLSPQYLLWLLPLFAFVLNFKELNIMFLITILTFMVYPVFYYEHLIQKETWMVLVLLLRNLLLVFLFFKIIFNKKLFALPGPKIVDKKIPEPGAQNRKKIGKI